MVNWCAALGTVLANDEVVNGVSERGGYPVEKKIMRQWCLRVSAYAQRLLDGLDTIDWTDSLKRDPKELDRTQRRCRGSLQGKRQRQGIHDLYDPCRYDVWCYLHGISSGKRIGSTINYGRPKAEVDAYLDRTKKRTERAAHRRPSGNRCIQWFYAINPFTGEAVPIWISDYVLAGYGTGAIMAVPAHDSRDYAL